MSSDLAFQAVDLPLLVDFAGHPKCLDDVSASAIGLITWPLEVIGRCSGGKPDERSSGLAISGIQGIRKTSEERINRGTVGRNIRGWDQADSYSELDILASTPPRPRTVDTIALENKDENLKATTQALALIDISWQELEGNLEVGRRVKWVSGCLFALSNQFKGGGLASTNA